MIDLLKTKEMISKSDPLTGILNRRGFLSEAKTALERGRQHKSDILLAYIDMNNLKMVNDQYGHEEGDFSLKLIGQTLQAITSEYDGAAGRIGGNEYACVLPYTAKDEGQSFIQKINQSFESFNISSSKSYKITVSVGTYIVQWNSTVSLEDALSFADEQLYEVKKHRRKAIAK